MPRFNVNRLHAHSTRLLERASQLSGIAERYDCLGCHTLAQVTRRQSLRHLALAAAAPIGA